MDRPVPPEDEQRVRQRLHQVGREVERQLDDADAPLYLRASGDRTGPARLRTVAATAALVLVVASAAVWATRSQGPATERDTALTADQPALPGDPEYRREEPPQTTIVETPRPGEAPADEVEAVRSILGLPNVLEDEAFPGGGWRATYGDESGQPRGEFSIGLGPTSDGRSGSSLQETILSGSRILEVEGVEEAYVRVASGMITISGLRNGKVLRFLVADTFASADEARDLYTRVVGSVSDF